MYVNGHNYFHFNMLSYIWCKTVVRSIEYLHYDDIDRKTVEHVSKTKFCIKERFQSCMYHLFVFSCISKEIQKNRTE